MKKLLKIGGIGLVLLVLIILIIPFAFKGKIIDLVKAEANKNLNATVDFADVNLSLFSNFPNFTVEIEQLSVVGIGEFAGDTLTSIELLHCTLDFMSVVSGDQIKINSIAIEKPRIHVWVMENGLANYDIAKESAETEVEEETPSSEESAPVSLNIDSYEINNAHILYEDYTMDMVVDIKDFTHSGQGDFSEDVFTLLTESSIAAFSMDYEGMTYLKEAAVSLDADLAMNMTEMKFSFMENMLMINALGLGFDGWVSMPSDDIDMDLSYHLLKNDLTEILSLVPAEFASDLTGVTANGDVSFDGYVKGIYNETTMPGFGVALEVGNGSIQYPDLPKSIENIQILAEVNSPEGSAEMEGLKLAVDQFYMEIGKSATEPNTIDAKLLVTNVMTSPDIDASLNADLNLGSFKDVVPLEEDFELAGKFVANTKVAGNVDDITNQKLDKFTAEGTAGLTNFKYKDATQDVAIDRCEIALNPQRLDLKTLEMNYDGMEMSLNGYVEDYVVYALTDTTLIGEFNFTADVLDANKYMEEESTSEATQSVSEAEAAVDTSAMEIVLIPNNLDIILNANIGKVLYDDLVLDNLKGVITVKNEIATLENTSFKTLGGDFEMSGAYNTQNHEVPTADFAYTIVDLDLKQAVETFNTVEKIAPIAKYATGKISTDLIFKTDLDSAMNPITSSINAKGNLQSKEILMEGGNFLGNLAETLKSPKLAKQKVDNLDANFIIRDGKITTSPFDVKLNDIEATVSGYSTFDNEIDYLMEMVVPRDELGSDFNKMAEGLLSSANALFGGSMSMGEYINVDVKITGALDDPTISPAFAGMDSGESIGAIVKETINAELEKQKEELEKQAREEAAKQAKKIMADARKEADKLMKEANKGADQIRDEADKQGQKLIDDSSNPFAKAGAKLAADQLKKEADKQAKKLVAEAQKNADKIIAAAQVEADKIK